MTSPSLVEVLLATYNGERFLRDQIDSILSQTYPNVTITTRDDGSTDGTDAILREYEARYPKQIRVLRDGVSTRHPKRNFERLMQASTAPYVALSDQDDVWQADKLAKQMQAMQASEKLYGATQPLLVFTDLEVVDDQMRTLAASFWKEHSIPGHHTDRFERLLTQNIFTGCTGLLNRALVERSLPIPDRAFMHDWWITLVASAFGHLIPLPVQSVRYRQHANNAVGAPKTGHRLVPSLRDHDVRRKGWEMSEDNAYAMRERFPGVLPAGKQLLVDAYIRAGSHPNRLVRVYTILRHGFLHAVPRANAGMLWYLWDMKAAKRRDL